MLLPVSSSSCRGAITISVWDAAAEFDTKANPAGGTPAGVWSYGWKTALTGRFFLLSTAYRESPCREGWCSASGIPRIYHSSRTVAAIPNAAGPITTPPPALSLTASPNGDYGVVRFTAPANGIYRVSGQFYAQEDNSTAASMDVWILPENNRTGAFSGMVKCQGGVKPASFTGTVFQLDKGSTLDFQAGGGSNRNVDHATIGLNVLIEKTRDSAKSTEKKMRQLHFLCNASQKIPKE